MTTNVIPVGCPACGDDVVVRLPGDWQEQVALKGARIAVVGCGKPWHYAGPDDVRERLIELVGTTDESKGLKHWHHVWDGEAHRPGVFVDRGQVLAAIDEAFGPPWAPKAGGS